MILHGNCLDKLKELEANSVDCCVTSPPYWGLRDYGVEGQFGLEKTPEEYVDKMVQVFKEVRRVLKDEATIWLNLGDSYATGNGAKNTLSAKQNSNKGSLTNGRKQVSGLKHKDLVGIPWRVAFALRQDGWYLRQDIIWHKPNPMPESVKDRCTKAHEYIFLLSKSAKYYFDNESIKEPAVYTRRRTNITRGQGYGKAKGMGSKSPDRDGGFECLNGKKNRRSVWTVIAKPFRGAHFATFPQSLVEPCILAGCPKGGVVLDPFFGAGTTGLVAKKHNRNFIGIEMNEEYVKIAEKRISHG